MCGHIYKCGFTYISVSVIFTAIYRFLTQTAPYTNTERRAVVLAMQAPGTRTPHTQTCGAHALHVILFEGASRSTAAFHKRSTAACTSQTFDSCTSQTFDSCTSVLLHLGDRKKIVAVPSNCADHYAFLCQTVVEWTGECRLWMIWLGLGRMDRGGAEDFQASHKDRIKAVISIPDESSEVTNCIIVGKKEENSKVLAECSDVRIVCQFSYTKAISLVSRSNWSVLIVTLIQLLHIIMLLSTQMPFFNQA